MQERIKQARKALGLTQSEFGEKLGIKGNTVTTYETGTRRPPDAIIISMCKIYGINEIWLRTGIGDMFDPISRDEQIAMFMGDVLAGKPDFRRRLIGILSDMTPDEWKILEKYVLKLAEECQNNTEDNEEQ